MKHVMDALTIIEEEYGEESIHLCSNLILSGNIHRDLGNVTNALVNYKQCLRILRKSPKYLSEAEVNHEIGTLFSSNGSLNKAVAYYAKSLRHATTRLGFENKEVARALCAIGSIARKTTLNLDSIAFVRLGEKICPFSSFL